jgi:DNA-binding response OmpR family regulator
MSISAAESKSMQLEHRPVALIVGADTVRTALIRKALVEARFEVHETERGDTALAMLGSLAPALMLLDWNLPDMSALAITRAIRRKTGFTRLPVVLTGTSISVENKILALEAGADYCYDGTIYPHELVARIRALLRRSMER